MRQAEFSKQYDLPQHMDKLDGVRAIAVIMVFYHHLIPWSYQLNLPWGDTGVDPFFVPSGFLIAGILLKCRKYREIDGQSVTVTLRRLYTRRFLRIFPRSITLCSVRPLFDP